MRNRTDSFKKENGMVPVNGHLQKMLYFSTNEEKPFIPSNQVYFEFKLP